MTITAITKPLIHSSYWLRSVFAIVLLFILFKSVHAQSLPDSIPLRILIIRHGEKPDSGYNLNCQGWNRAMALAGAIVPQFGIPDQIYVPDMKTGKKTKSVRMYQTVIPFAIKYNLIVNSKYEETDSVELADNLKLQKGTYLVVWDKKNIPALVRHLGIRENELSWPDQDYDAIWIIEYTRDREGLLLPRMRYGREGLHPSSVCEY